MQSPFVPAKDRSELMARIKRANTKPEMALRRALHRLGYRYRVQLKGVPGRPDIAFPARKHAIFVHGCFWHAHENCRKFRMPRTRPDFWRAKFDRNRERDQRLQAAAEAAGWQCTVVWECELDRLAAVVQKLTKALGAPRKSALSSATTSKTAGSMRHAPPSARNNAA